MTGAIIVYYLLTPKQEILRYLKKQHKYNIYKYINHTDERKSGCWCKTIHSYEPKLRVNVIDLLTNLGF